MAEVASDELYGRAEARVQCLDHVLPRVRSGRNSYRNLVSSCVECNSQKGERPAADFLRWLYRHRRLTDAELTARLRALDALASGKLPPPLAATANPRTLCRQLERSSTTRKEPH